MVDLVEEPDDDPEQRRVLVDGDEPVVRERDRVAVLQVGEDLRRREDDVEVARRALDREPVADAGPKPEALAVDPADALLLPGPRLEEDLGLELDDRLGAPRHR